MPSPDHSKMEGARVIITKGAYAGHEGICLGAGTAPKTFAVSPDGSHEIIELRFEQEFGLVIDLSSDPTKN